MILLSIVIPVYNAEEYLPATIESILKQTVHNYEVILVDDGSKDGSAALCDNYSSRYNFISVIHKSNGGVSSARNVGIENARGKYITFVDADDKVAPVMMEDLLSELEEKHADKVFCGHKEISFAGRSIERVADLPSRILLDRDFIVNTLLYTGCVENSYMNSVWGGVFKIQLIVDNGLRFANRPMGEDWLFNMQYCDLAQSIVYVNQPYYKYVRNSDSAMSRYHANQFDLWLENRAFRNGLIEKYGFQVDAKHIDSSWVARVFYYLLQCIQKDATYKKKFKLIFSNKEFNKAVKNATALTPIYIQIFAWMIKRQYHTFALYYLKILSKIK